MKPNAPMKRWLVAQMLTAVSVGGLAFSAAAWAQPAPAQNPAPAPAASPPGAVTASGSPDAEGPKVKVEKGAGGKTVYRITEAIRIEGKIQKPEAFYVLQKSSINYDWQDLKQDFVPKIVDSVSRAPF
jgi:hypothetical protein